MVTLLRYRRFLSLFILTGLLPFSGLAGCASSPTKQVDHWSGDEPYTALQGELAGQNVTIFLGDGTVHRGQAVLINAEWISWQVSDLPERYKAATSEVWKLEVRRGTKAGKGAATGFLVGAGFGFMIGVTSDDADFLGGRAGAGAVIGLAFGLVGTIIGAVAGSTSQSLDTFVINPEFAPSTAPETGTANDSVDAWLEGQ